MLLFVFTSILAFGQEEAKRYMDLFTKGEYAEVVDYFEKQYRSNATNYYETLRICYIGLKRYDDAESLIKKQLLPNDQMIAERFPESIPHTRRVVQHTVVNPKIHPPRINLW